MTGRTDRRWRFAVIAALAVLGGQPLLHTGADVVTSTTVVGRMVKPDGTPAAGAIVHLAPIDPDRTVAHSATPTAVATSDALGLFTLNVPPSDELLRLAAANSGSVNFNLYARLEPKEAPSDDLDPPAASAPTGSSLSTDTTLPPVSDAGTVAIDPSGAKRDAEAVLTFATVLALQLVNLEDGDEALVFTPVNVATLVLNAAVGSLADAIDLGVGISTEGDGGEYPPTEDDPYGAPLADTPSGQEGDPRPPAPTPPPAVREVQDQASEQWSERPQVTQAADDQLDLRKDEEGEYPPPPPAGEACKGQAENQYYRYPYRRQVFWEPVGELHTGTYLTGELTYGTTASTHLGGGIDYGKGWARMAMTTHVANSTGVFRGIRRGPGYYRQVLADFEWVHTVVYWCGHKGTTSGQEVDAYDHQEITSVRWNGRALRDGPRDLSAYNQRDDWERAVKAAYTRDMGRGGIFEKQTGKGHRYTTSVTAFGLTVFSAETNFSADRKLRLEAPLTHPRKNFHFFGNNNKPDLSEVVYVFH